MEVAVIVCDNCGQKVRTLEDGRAAQTYKPNARVAGRKYDLCATCSEGRPVDLSTAPLSEWPRLVRREDVRRYLERLDSNSARLAGEAERLREQLARAEERAAPNGETVDLALELANLRHDAKFPQRVEALQARARELTTA